MKHGVGNQKNTSGFRFSIGHPCLVCLPNYWWAAVAAYYGDSTHPQVILATIDGSFALSQRGYLGGPILMIGNLWNSPIIQSSWRMLDLLWEGSINFLIPMTPEIHWGHMLQKPGDPSEIVTEEIPRTFPATNPVTPSDFEYLFPYGYD